MSVTVATVDLDRLNRRFLGLRSRFAALQGRAVELQEQKTRLSHGISLAKARIEMAPQAAECFTYLQERAHARAVGDFEELMSAFLADVVPDAGKICLELGTERGAPALDILLDNGGDMESILDGNGGGLTNVVVTGLAFSALSRTKNRQLMVLDEPDCWLKAKYIPNFTRVIADVANPRLEADGSLSTGIQTLMISHNDVGLMDEGAHIQDLRIEYDLEAYAARLGLDVSYSGEPSDCAYVVWAPKDGSSRGALEVRYREDGMGDDEINALTKGFPVVDTMSGAKAWEPTMPGVRWVEVVNLRRHVHTRLELSPGLNVLTGDINGGKSTLYFTAIRAMAYGESDDTMIRHGADSAMVRLGLEDDVILELVRSRKGSPKVMFRLYRAGRKEHEERPTVRGGVPDFIIKALNIQRVDNLDIQLRSQKDPVFLLNETAPRRAQLLSVGRESGLLQAVIERHRLQLRRDKDLVKHDELELNHVNRTLTVLEPLSSLAGLAEIIDTMTDVAAESEAAVRGTRSLVARMTPLDVRVRLGAAVMDGLSQALTAPVIVNTEPLEKSIGRIERSLHTAQMPTLPVAPVAPSCIATAGLGHSIARIERSHMMAQLPDMPSAPKAPACKATDGITQAIGRLERSKSVAQLADMPVVPTAPRLTDTKNIRKLGVVLATGERATTLVGLMPALPLLPVLADTAGIRRDGVNLDRQSKAIQVLEKDALTVDTEVVGANTALHDLKHELGVCPTCNQSFPETSHV